MRLVVAAVLMLSAVGPAAAQTDALLRIVAPDLPPGTRLMGFDLTIQSGRIAVLRQAPPGWRLTIDNDPSWHARITANAVVGAAALEDADLARLFLLAAAPDSVRASFPEVLQVSGRIEVMKDGEMQEVKLTRLQTRPVEPATK